MKLNQLATALAVVFGPISLGGECDGFQDRLSCRYMPESGMDPSLVRLYDSLTDGEYVYLIHRLADELMPELRSALIRDLFDATRTG